MATYTKKIIFGSAIVLSMDFFGSVIAYLTRMVLARNLTPAEYGLFYAVFTFVLFLLFFRDLGLNQALVKYISEFKTKNKYNKIKTTILSVLNIELLCSSILIILLFILSKYLSENYFKNTSAYMILNILLVYIFFSVLFRALKYIFQGFQKIKLYASSEFLKNLIVLLLILVFFKLKFSIFSPTLAYALVCPILFFLFLPFALKTFPFFKYKIENFKPITKKILSFGIPVFITAVSGKVFGYIDTLMLTGMRSLTEVGVYNVILPSALLFLFFGSSVASVVFPMTS